jgi:hypothetical protein
MHTKVWTRREGGESNGLGYSPRKKETQTKANGREPIKSKKSIYQEEKTELPSLEPPFLTETGGQPGLAPLRPSYGFLPRGNSQTPLPERRIILFHLAVRRLLYMSFR